MNHKKKNSIYIYHAAQVVTPIGTKGLEGSKMKELTVIEDGAVLIIDGIIKAVGSTNDVKSLASEHVGIDTLDASGKIILPGFVDSHTHFVYAGDRAKEYNQRLQGVPYMEIHKQGGGIQSSVNATREASFDTLIELGQERLDQAMIQGVTTIEGKSGYGLNWENELKQLNVMKELNEIHPISIVSTYMAAHSVPAEFKGQSDAYIDQLIEKDLPKVASQQLAEFCDVFCEDGVFSIDQSRRLLEAAKSYGLKLKIHADEVVDLGGAELAADLGAISADHLLKASKENFHKMKEKDVIATLLPVTAFSLGTDYPDARYLLDQDLKVALATDYNPGSCHSYNISFLIALATRQLGMPIESVITALTLNGAAALDLADKTGTIQVGKCGDLVIHDCPNYQHLAYEIANNTVETVIKDGNVIWSTKEVSNLVIHEEQDAYVTEQFAQRRVMDLLAETASSNPVPGGGSIAAHSGATAAALVEMVTNLTIGRKKYSDVESLMKEVQKQIHPIQLRLLELMDEDADSYNQVMLAYGLPKGTDDEKELRSNAIQSALKGAAEKPLEVAGLCKEVLDFAGIVVEKGNSNAKTDGIVAAMTARTGLLGALYNVKINLGSITDEAFVMTYQEKINILTAYALEKESMIMGTMELV